MVPGRTVPEEQGPSEKSLFFESLPFFTGLLDTPDTGSLPVALPFALEFDRNLSLIVGRNTSEGVRALEEAYRRGSLVSTGLGQGSFGERRSRDVLRHLELMTGGRISGSSVLEIGCADGFLLHRLREMGASGVMGCEPGPMAWEGARRYGIEILNDFFRPGLISRTFNLVFCNGVLEHIEQPLEFLRSMMEVTAPGGRVFVGVPNCERKLRMGDIEILGHEHWNYFTRNSLKHLMGLAGLGGISARVGMNQAMIYGWGRKVSAADESAGVPPTGVEAKEEALFRNFAARVRRAIPLLQERVWALEEQGRALGLYAGGINTIGLLRTRDEPRFFNGDIATQGRYYPGFSRPVESPGQLIADPPDEVWIMATDYDEEIRGFLSRKAGIPAAVMLLSMKKFLLGIPSSPP